MVEDGEQELEFLEIDPAERLFDFILDEGLCGESFRSVLFGRAVRVEFGSWAECEGPDWVRISSDDPACVEIEIGYLDEGLDGATYFSTGKSSCITDDDCLYGLDNEVKKEALLEYLRCTIEYGYVEYVGDFSGPLRTHNESPGWFHQWKIDERQAQKRYASKYPKGRGPPHGALPTILLFLVFSPLLIPLILYAVIRSIVVRGLSTPRRYPPFPVE